MFVFKAAIRHSVNITTEPENGTMFTDLEGSMNSTSFTCNIFHTIDSEQQNTVWRLQKPKSKASEFIFYSNLSSMFHAPNDSYKNNKLIVHNLTSELDGVTIFCENEVEIKLAFFTLKINREFFSFKDLPRPNFNNL